MGRRVFELLAAVLCACTSAKRISYNTPFASPKEYSDTVLNVHVVPHTHDDVGWLKTVDQYYYGANNTIQHACVEYIIDSVVSELFKNPDRRFTYVEIAFFARWFYDQTDTMQDKVRKIVARGQLDFVNGGWCMQDEASTHYVAMIDQTTLGHQFLAREFDGFAPKVGWQIDPFGHSATQASLLSWGAGFDALFFGRIDYQDRELRQASQECEGVWRASPSLGPDAQIFWGLTGSYGGNYGSPAGYNFDRGNDNAIPVMDNEYLSDYNVQSRVDGIVAAALAQGVQTKGNHIMFTMGSDFHYEAAQEYFDNLDKLIHYTNELAGDQVKIFYSTPTRYMEAKNNETDIAWQVKTDDFFPYADGAHAYWTGYFTSRPLLKRFERVTSGYLLAVRQLEVLTSQQPTPSMDGFGYLSAASGVNQHHDAVSGTAKQHVTDDYAQRLARGVNEAAVSVANAVTLMASSNLVVDPANVVECPLLNESICLPTATASAAGETFGVFAYNPLAQARSTTMAVPVAAVPTSVTDVETMETVDFQVVDSQPIESSKEEAMPWVLYFKTGDIAPLNSKSFLVAFDDADAGNDSERVSAPEPMVWGAEGDEFSVENGEVVLYFSNETGRLTRISYSNEEDEDSVEVDVDQGFGYYYGFDSDLDLASLEQDERCGAGSEGECPVSAEVMDHLHRAGMLTPHELHTDQTHAQHPATEDTQNSGAYIFRPNVPNAVPVEVGDGGKALSVEVVSGPLVIEVRQCFSSWVNQTIRLISGQSHATLEYTIGPVPIDDGLGKEVITLFKSSVKNSGTTSEKPVLQTDSNGREFMKRVYGERPTWDVNISEPVAGNYYPMNAAAYVKDDEAQLSVLTDRTQGVASLSEGQIEVMVHRRLLVDDGRGVGEPMNETDGGITSYADTDCAACRIGEGIVVRGQHVVQLHVPDKALKHIRSDASKIFSPVMTAFFTLTTDISHQPIISHGSDQAEVEALPENVKLLTLESMQGGDDDTQSSAVLVRLEHTFAIDEDAVLSLPVEVNVTSFLRSLGLGDVSSATEVTLTANQELVDLDRLSWNTGDEAAVATATGGVKPRTTTALPPRGVGGKGIDWVAQKGGVLTLNPMEIRSAVVRFAASSKEETSELS